MSGNRRCATGTRSPGLVKFRVLHPSRSRFPGSPCAIVRRSAWFCTGWFTEGLRFPANAVLWGLRWNISRERIVHHNPAGSVRTRTIVGAGHSGSKCAAHFRVFFGSRRHTVIYVEYRFLTGCAGSLRILVLKYFRFHLSCSFLSCNFFRYLIF